jgi:dethiobiotin synthetase
MSTYFVTATGTDLGKTYVLCRILALLRSRGAAVHALKPVLSGFDSSDPASTDSGRLSAGTGASRQRGDDQRDHPLAFSATPVARHGGCAGWRHSVPG